MPGAAADGPTAMEAMTTDPLAGLPLAAPHNGVLLPVADIGPAPAEGAAHLESPAASPGSPAGYPTLAASALGASERDSPARPGVDLGSLHAGEAGEGGYPSPTLLGSARGGGGALDTCAAPLAGSAPGLLEHASAGQAAEARGGGAQAAGPPAGGALAPAPAEERAGGVAADGGANPILPRAHEPAGSRADGAAPADPVDADMAMADAHAAGERNGLSEKPAGAGVAEPGAGQPSPARAGHGTLGKRAR